MKFRICSNFRACPMWNCLHRYFHVADRRCKLDGLACFLDPYSEIEGSLIEGSFHAKCIEVPMLRDSVNWKPERDRVAEEIKSWLEECDE